MGEAGSRGPDALEVGRRRQRRRCACWVQPPLLFWGVFLVKVKAEAGLQNRVLNRRKTRQLRRAPLRADEAWATAPGRVFKHRTGHQNCSYTGGAAIAAPLPVLLILSLPMAGQREELYSLKGATLPYRYAHPDTVVVVDQQLLTLKLLALSTEYRQRYET